MVCGSGLTCGDGGTRYVRAVGGGTWIEAKEATFHSFGLPCTPAVFEESGGDVGGSGVGESETVEEDIDCC